MNDRQMQFRVGLFVLIACGLIGAMIFSVGELDRLWEKTYQIAVHFESAPGVYAGSPVKINGIKIGVVKQVELDDERGGVGVIVDIRERVRLRSDCQPQLATSLLGDSSIEILPGKSDERLEPGTLIEGLMPSDPMSAFNRLERQLSQAIGSFEQTSTEFRKVATNVNSLLDGKNGNLHQVVEQTALALTEFTQTMQQAKKTLAASNQILADPRNQENLRQTLAALPEVSNEVRQTVAVARRMVASAQQNLDNLQQLTVPLAQNAEPLVQRLNRSLANFDTLSAELAKLSKVAAREDGSLRKFMEDPQLYRNLNQSAESISILMTNLEPVIRDLRIFSDKVARHPELLGVGGAMKGSTGLKEIPEAEQRRPVADEPNRPTRAANRPSDWQTLPVPTSKR